MSIFSAETYGIIVTLNYILQHDIDSSVIYTDSLSVMQAICSPHKTKNFLVRRAQYLASLITNRKHRLTFCWVPSHVGILGNEGADYAAAAAMDCDITPFEIPVQDLVQGLQKCIKSEWQESWDTQENKLHLVERNIETQKYPVENRLQETLRCRLRIGHTYATHGFLLRGEEPPQCTHCSVQLTVIHILTSCPLFESQRRKNFSRFYQYCIPLHPALLLGDEPLVPFENVFNFIQDIDLIGNL